MPKRGSETAQEKMARYRRKLMKLAEQEKLDTVDSSSDSEQDISKRQPQRKTDGASTISAPTPMEEVTTAPAPTPAPAAPARRPLGARKQLDPALFAALGEADDTSELGEKIHNRLVIIWEPILIDGLSDKRRDRLLGAYLVPENCTLLNAPEMNKDILNYIKKQYQDERIKSEQQQLGVGIAAIGSALMLLLADGDERVVRILADACRILTDAHHQKTKLRGNLVKKQLPEYLQTIVQECTRDETLFGNALGEKINSTDRAVDRQLQLFYQNVRGLRTKINLFYNNIIVSNYDLLLFTETWLHRGILDWELCDNRFDLFRCDRGSLGGGVMVACAARLRAHAHPHLVPPYLECVWLKIPAQQLNITRNLHIAVVYLPPDRCIPIRVDDFLLTLFKVKEKYPNDHIIVSGDFNLPCVDWACGRPIFMKKGLVEIQNSARRLVNTMLYYGLRQHSVITNMANNTLDLIFSNAPLNIMRSYFSMVPEDTSHPALDLNTYVNIPP